MLTYKKYKQLKKRLNSLTYLSNHIKSQIKYSARHKDQYTLSVSLRKYSDWKSEINYILEILKLHKILWKQHLCLIEFNKG